MLMFKMIVMEEIPMLNFMFKKKLVTDDHGAGERKKRANIWSTILFKK